MSEIRNLTRNGETFYPLTIAEAVSDPSGNYIGNYVSNPEWIRVITDNEGKVLAGIKANGEVEWSLGVPTPIKEYIQDILSNYSTTSEIQEALSNIQTALSGKVDKEEGKSLIPTQYIQEIENPEYIEAKVDADNKVIEATEKDGTKVIGGNVKVLGSIDVSGVNYKVVSNPEWLEVVLDSEDRIICGIKTDGKFVVYMADFFDDIDAIKTRLEELDAYSVTENPEFMEVELDADDKILGGRKTDGTKFENNDVELNSNVTVGGSLEVGGVVFKNIEDLENRSEITLDSEKKIISYRDSDGVKHENAGIETDNANINHLNLTDTGMTEFQQALKDSGFRPGGAGDWSEDGKDFPLRLPFPKVAAKINFIVDRPITEECLNPFTGEDEQSGLMEYYDYYGNYFKKPCTINTQGQTSQRNRKKNIGLDIDDGSEISFGDWVPQDSFHIKTHPNDITGTRLVSAYRFAEKVYQAIGGRPFDAINDDSSISYLDSTGNIYADFKNNVLCHPDGFAVEIYFNGEWWGLGMLQLKKHRKNYGMNKKDYESVLLDMNETLNYFWGGKDTIGWTVQGMMDIKNPKTLIAMDGSEWEEGKELIDSSSPVYNPDNKDMKNTAKTKKVIEDMADSYNEVLSLESELDNNTAAKAKFEELFDKNACEAVYIINCFLNNGDSIKKNTLWMKYKNGKIAPAPYDLDGIYGGGVTGLSVSSPGAGLWSGPYATSAWPLSFIWKFYSDNIAQKYAELRRSGVISIAMFEKLFKDLYEQQSFNAIEREIDKWTPAPYRDAGTLNSAYWKIGTYGNENIWTQWDKDTQYQINDCVFVVGDKNVNVEAVKGERLYGVKYTCVAPNQNQCPVDIIYDNFPYTGGMYDSIKRELKWIEEQIRLCDIKLGYSE